jgi:hypothetical protein
MITYNYECEVQLEDGSKRVFTIEAKSLEDAIEEAKSLIDPPKKLLAVRPKMEVSSKT